MQRRYVHGPGTDEPLVWYEGPGTSGRRFLHADERGSIVAVSDSAGTVIAVNKYDEYGKPAPANIGRFQYTGQAWLPELQLYYYKNRMYHPALGRFLQPDPIGYGDGLNLYNYVGSDPVNSADPSGLMCTGSIICRGGSGGGVNTVSCYGNCGSFSSWYGVGSAKERAGSGNPEGQHLLPGAPARNGPNENEVIVTGGHWVSDSKPFYFNGEKFVPNPHYVKPWYSSLVDYGLVLGPPLAGLAAAVAPEVAAGVAARMAHSPAFGVASSRFGNTRYFGRQGSWNYGSVRVGWSYNKNTGLMTFQPRIGNYHVPSPLKTPPL